MSIKASGHRFGGRTQTCKVSRCRLRCFFDHRNCTVGAANTASEASTAVHTAVMSLCGAIDVHCQSPTELAVVGVRARPVCLHDPRYPGGVVEPHHLAVVDVHKSLWRVVLVKLHHALDYGLVSSIDVNRVWSEYNCRYEERKSGVYNYYSNSKDLKY